MRSALLVVMVGCFSIHVSLGQASDAQRRATYYEQLQKRIELDRRIRQSEPKRRDTPLRFENIQDDEVREIQSQMSQLFFDQIVSIGAVVTGCPCEESSACTDQVWVLVHSADKTDGQLSKISGHWKIGPTQSWWLDYKALQARRSTFRSYKEYENVEQTLKEKFPGCSFLDQGKR